jgi:SPP1 gp7 family putative phage head morphogenesis protein
MVDTEWPRLPFKEAIAFFKQKAALPTRTWRDIEKSAHDRAFVVAGLARMSALEEIQTVIARQMEQGISYKAFQKQFDAIIDRAGWEPKGGRSWRARLIFETNIRTAHSAGRRAHLEEPAAKKALAYIQYRHSGAEHFRPLHKSWDGLVLSRDDKFWQTNTPPNGFGCKCQWFPLSARSLRRLGKEGPDQNPYDMIADQGGETTYKSVNRATGEVETLPRGVDPGWNYRPGEAWLRGVTPIERGVADTRRFIPPLKAVDPMLPARAFDARRILDGGLSEEELARRFLDEFGAAGSPVFFDDKIGNLLTISDQLFKDAKGAWKIRKRGRDPYLLALADTIKDPDEIFALLEYQEKEKTWRTKLRYIAQFTVPGKDQPLISVFEWGDSTWSGKTGFIETTPGYVDTQRQGVRLYRRSQK